MSHATRPVLIGGRKVEIDLGLADLVEVCVRNEIETIQSCESWGDDGLAWLQFRDFEDLSRFVGKALGDRANDDRLASKMRRWEIIDPWPSDEDGAWRFTVAPAYITDGQIFWDAAVRFPLSDVPEILSRLDTIPS